MSIEDYLKNSEAYVRQFEPTFNYAMFAKVVGNLGSVVSVSGQTFYDKIRVESDKVYFTRRSTGKEESIRLDELFEFYDKCNRYTTTAAKEYISGRVQSPATAMVIAAAKLEEKNSTPQSRRNINRKRKFLEKVEQADGCQIGCGIIVLLVIVVLVIGVLSGDSYTESDECVAVLNMGWGAYEKKDAEKIVEYMMNQDTYGLLSYELEGYIESFKNGEKFKFVRMEKGGYYVVFSNKSSRPLYVPNGFLEFVKPEKKKKNKQ